MIDDSELLSFKEFSHLEVLLPLNHQLTFEVSFIALVLCKLSLLQSILLFQELNLTLLVSQYGLQFIMNSLLELLSLTVALSLIRHYFINEQG